MLLLYMLNYKYFSGVNVENVLKTSNEFLLFIDDCHPDVAAEIKDKKKVSPELEDRIKAACEEFVKGI